MHNVISAWTYKSLAAMIISVLWLWLAVGSAQPDMNGAQADRNKMAWVSSSNSTALCNDFTRAGFFIRQNPSSRDWVVFLESGGLCYNTESCNRRFFVRQVGQSQCAVMVQFCVRGWPPYIVSVP
jgi:hypothetical protein